MSTKKSGPTKKGGKSNNSMSYSVGPREAKTTQISSGGLGTVKSGTDPEKGTSGIC